MSDKNAELQGLLWRIQSEAKELSYQDIGNLDGLYSKLTIILANSSEAIKLSDELYVERVNQNGGGSTDETFKG